MLSWDPVLSVALCSYISGGLFSAVPVSKDENVLTNIVLNVVQEPAADSDTVLLEGSLHKYCLMCPCPFQEVPNQHEQGRCNVQMKVILILTDPFANLRHDLGLQTFDYGSFNEEDIEETVY